MTALVEPPDWDLGLEAREGGCRLMFALYEIYGKVEDFGHSGEVVR
jgi:hypothetical protein